MDKNQPRKEVITAKASDYTRLNTASCAFEDMNTSLIWFNCSGVAFTWHDRDDKEPMQDAEYEEVQPQQLPEPQPEAKQ